MEYALEIAEDRGLLTLNGPVTVEQARELHGSLLDPRGAVADLAVDLSGVNEIDVTCLQLLCAAHHAAAPEGRRLRLVNVGDGLRESIEQLGFLRHVGCSGDKSGSCLWMMLNR